MKREKWIFPLPVYIPINKYILLKLHNKKPAYDDHSSYAGLVMGFSLLSAWQARNKKPPAMRVETIRYTHKNTFPLR